MGTVAPDLDKTQALNQKSPTVDFCPIVGVQYPQCRGLLTPENFEPVPKRSL